MSGLIHSPTSAKITVRSGAAGKAMAMFISNICSKSTGENKGYVHKENILITGIMVNLVYYRYWVGALCRIN